MGPRKQPLVYLDACCFGVIAQRKVDLEALRALMQLLDEFEFRRLRFASSSWLEFEINRILPPSRRRRVRGLVPNEDAFIPWGGIVARDAQQWKARLGMKRDAPEEADCRHLACAMHAGSNYLVTHDNHFFEAMRQHVKLLTPLTPVRLIGWQEVIRA
jgi:predicted nucleic acid-binding protein